MAYLTPNTQVDYKFYNGNNLSSTELVPSSCAQGGNRIINNVDSAQILPTVCFGGCVNCSPLYIKNSPNKNTFSLAPNPMSLVSTLSFNDDASFHTVSILDLQGRVVKQINNITTNTIQINKEMLASSCYFLHIMNDKNEQTRLKLIIE
jgi:hypothetical protein